MVYELKILSFSDLEYEHVLFYWTQVLRLKVFRLVGLRRLAQATIFLARFVKKHSQEAKADI